MKTTTLRIWKKAKEIDLHISGTDGRQESSKVIIALGISTISINTCSPQVVLLAWRISCYSS